MHSSCAVFLVLCVTLCTVNATVQPCTHRASGSLHANLHGGDCLNTWRGVAVSCSTTTATTTEALTTSTTSTSTTTSTTTSTSTSTSTSTTTSTTTSTGDTTTVTTTATPRSVFHTTASLTFLTMDFFSNGFPVFAWKESNQLKFVACLDVSCSSTSAVQVVDNSANIIGNYASLIVLNDIPLIAYQDFSNLKFKYAYCSTSACGSFVLKTLDATYKTGSYVSIKANQNGKVLISSISSVSDNYLVNLAVCTDYTCDSFSNLPIVSGVGTLGQTSLQINSANKPVIAFYIINTGDVKIAFCGDETCTSNTVKDVDTSSDVGQYAALQLTSADVPVIAYRDTELFNFKLAICSDATCTSATVKVLEQGGGNYPSVLLVNNVPMVAHYDGSNADLKLVTCSDAACSSFSSVLVDSAGSVGSYPNLRKTASGAIIITYVDGTNKDIKLASP